MSDPEADGLPGTADPDSSADSRPDDPRDPAPLPGDIPLGLEAFGVTADEMRREEPLSRRLIEEEPEVSTRDIPIEVPEEEMGETGGLVEAGPAAAAEEIDELVDPLINPDEVLEPPFEPHLGSMVSEYETLRTPRTIGRIASPEGPHTDLDGEDVGPAGGGLTMEEQAMHEEIPE